MVMWEVFTPMYQTWHGGEYDPAEYGADWEMVEADTAREAKVKAVRIWRERRTQWTEDARSDNANPYSRLTALPVFYGPWPEEVEE